MRYVVRIGGRAVIGCDTLDEAEDWADLLGTSYAPATVVSA